DATSHRQTYPLSLHDALPIYDALNDLRDRLARFGQTLDPFAMALEDLDSKFIFKLDDGLGHARLRCVETASCLSEIEVAAYGFPDKAELLKVHENSPVRRGYYR